MLFGVGPGLYVLLAMFACQVPTIARKFWNHLPLLANVRMMSQMKQ
jgi:hypothetical protein